MSTVTVTRPGIRRTIPAQPWGVLAIITAGMVALAVVGWELHCRQLGYSAGLDDTLDLWVEQRRTVQPDDTVIIGSSVKISNGKKEYTYTIVGPAESNPAEGFISYETPLGSALMGHKKGDDVIVKTPTGNITWKILDIK